MEAGKVRWKCRRGMLELDMLLLPFFDAHYANLPEEQQIIFQKLLDASDPQLLAWILGHEVVEDSEIQSVLKLIHRTSR